MSTADYKVYIDWDKDNGLSLANFEQTTDGWEAYGSTPPTVAIDTTRAITGTYSLLVEWVSYNPFQFGVSGRGFSQGRFGTYGFSNPVDAFRFDTAGAGFDDGRFGFAEASDTTVTAPEARGPIPTLRVDSDYTLSAKVWVPTGSPPVRLNLLGNTDTSSWSSTNDAWEELTIDFTAVGTSDTIRLEPQTEPDTGDKVWLDRVQIQGVLEDMTNYVLTRDDIVFSYGRDLARSLSSIVPGTSELEIDNQSRYFSPENISSPIYNDLGPGKPVYISATFQGTEYPLYQGFLDDYEIHPGLTQDRCRSIRVSTTDLLGQAGERKISTQLYPSIQTGEALEVILDEIGWPADDRIIDQGATTMRWWWAEGDTAAQAIADIVASEGMPCLIYVDGVGNLVFRSRHHRVLSDASITTQEYFTDDGSPEPGFSDPDTDPFQYMVGWRDLYNDVSIEVDERQPTNGYSTLFENGDSISLRAGETRELIVKSSDPFYNAIAPVSGTDYTIQTPPGGTVNIDISRTSGQSLTLRIFAGPNNVTVQNLKVRGILVPVARTYKVTAQDTESIAKYGIKSFPDTMKWAGVNDVTPMLQVLLGQRAERLPVIRMTVNNDNDTRLAAMLTQKLSDRIHISETETFTDHDFYVEEIKHTISASGTYHHATFGCEKARDQVENVFTFDDAARGFDLGLFGRRGIDAHENVFVLGTSELDTGAIGH